MDRTAAGSSPISVMRKQPLISVQPPQLSAQAAWTFMGLLALFTLLLAIILWRRTRKGTR
ncbi:MAG: hypothetical protein Fur0021_28930 [Candidatus Promineifilaceae bacterium]